MLVLTAILLTSCSDKNKAVTYEDSVTYLESNEDKLPEKVEAATEVTTTEVGKVVDVETATDQYLIVTGEIIADGDYSFNYEHGLIYFVPDKESKEIIDQVNNGKEPPENYYLLYDDISKVNNIPESLGIYKVKVEMDHNFLIRKIEQTDKIGTILYEGKTYETNDLDYNVKVKDRVCGLIVQSIISDGTGIEIYFAGEIESEGYYSIQYNEMEGINTGKIDVDEEYYDNFPTFKGERNIFSIYFRKTNELFDELENHSAFGRGKFKTSGFYIVYNIARGVSPSESLKEIISLDEEYKKMFELSRSKLVYIKGISNDFVIVNSLDCEDDGHVHNIDYYYINKKNPTKNFMLSSEYYYELSDTINEFEFILSSNGYNAVTGQMDEAHNIRCIIEKDTGICQVIGR
jgi:hypothetical protein